MRRALAVSAIGAAVLMLIAGCAATDAVRSGRYRIEPVLDVTDSAASTDAWYAAGRFYDASRDWDHAIGAYRKALIADPKNVEAYNALGVALAQRGEFTASEAAFRSALDLEPARAHLRSNLGYVLYLAGRPREAVTELKLALRADRGDTTALNNLRSALARLDAAEAPPGESSVGRRDDVPESESDEGAVVMIKGRFDTGLADAPIDLELPVRVSLPAPLSAPVSLPLPLAAVRPPAPMAIRVIDRPTVAALDAGVARSGETTRAELPPAPVAGLSAAPRGEAEAFAFAVADARAGAKASLDIANGNGVRGAAFRLARWLNARGLPVGRLSNQPPFQQPLTVVMYGPGQEQAARRVADAMPEVLNPSLVPASPMRSDVRVVLGRDWQQAAACVEANACAGGAQRIVAVDVPR